METFFTKYRILIWIALFLLILNITILATILVRNNREKRIINHPAVTMRFQRPGPGVFMSEEIGLSDEQLVQYITLRDQYRQQVQEINQRIQLLRRNYLQALMVENPDIPLAQADADSIGLLHVRLMQETGKYYHQVRQICRDDQVPRLNAFFLGAMQQQHDAIRPQRGLHRGSSIEERNGRRSRLR
jgi:hypothetical protein